MHIAECAESLDFEQIRWAPCRALHRDQIVQAGHKDLGPFEVVGDGSLSHSIERESSANLPERIQIPKPCLPSEVRAVAQQLRIKREWKRVILSSRLRAKLFQRAGECLEVGAIAREENVEVAGDRRRAMCRTGHSANQDETDPGAAEDLQEGNRVEVTVSHGVGPTFGTAAALQLRLRWREAAQPESSAIALRTAFGRRPVPASG